MSLPSVNPSRSPSAIRRMMTAIALSRPGTWFYMRVASRIDPLLARISGGRLSTALGVLPVTILRVRGARSGALREVALVYFTDGDDAVLIASSFGRPRHPAWYHNITANPDVELLARGRAHRYHAREVQGPERDRLYELATQLYSGYRVYEQRAAETRRVPVLRLSPVEGVAG